MQLTKSWVLALPIVAAGLLGTAAWAGDEERKELSPRDQRRAEVEAAYAQFREPWTNNPERVIYGTDDRKDLYEVTSPFILGLAQATAVLLEPGDYTNNGNGTYTLNATRWLTQGGTPVCTTEPFRGQYQVGNCSAFLVGQDLIATAGHCVTSASACTGGIAFAFGFSTPGPGQDPSLVIPADNIYFCTQIVHRAYGGELDHAVVRVDRPVVGRTPVPIRRTGEVGLNEPLVMIGHPVVLPTKVDAGGVVQNPRPGGGWFYANVDAYGGNSGSAVFNLNTGVVEGILVRGNTDFETVSGCVRSRVCPDTGCSGDWEEISKTISFADYVPELGIVVSPAAAPLHIGMVGGPFNDPAVVYTLTNMKSDPADYTVSFQAGGDAPLLLNGGPGPVSGTIPGNDSVAVTVSLDPAVNLLPAGVYSTTVLFQDTTNNLSTTRTHVVEVGQTGFTVAPADGLIAGGPQGGPFTATRSYVVTSTRPTPVDVEVSASDAWIGLDGGYGPLNFTLIGTGDSRTVVVGFTPDANLLPNGLYNGGVLFANASGGAGDAVRPVQLDVGRYSYPSYDVPKPINDNSTITSIIDITDAYCIGDVDVEVNITHTYIGDLIVEVINPQGNVVRLHNRTGGSADDIIKTYDDGTVPPDGPGLLADFNGKVVTGTWTLRVSDNASIDTGTLNAWKLKIAAAGTFCPPEAFSQNLVVPDTVTTPVVLQAGSVTPPTYIITSLPSNGVLIDPQGGVIGAVPYALLAGGNVVNYKPTPLYVGPDSFQFKANNGLDGNVATISLRVGIESVIYSFPLNSSPGWTVEDQWAFGQPTGGGTSGRLDPTSGYTGLYVYGFNLNGHYPNSMATTKYLTTTALDFSHTAGVKMRFRRWLGIESATYDKANIDASANGVNWVTIWQHTGAAINEQAWSLQQYDLSAVADGQATVYVRWGMGPTDSSVTYQGWNLDDIEFLGLLPQGLLGDMNCDGVVNFDDIDAFVVALGGQSAYAAQYPDCIWDNADTNCDGVVNFDDIDPFVGCLTAGCACP
ncbi:MAG: proprotein convertase P-domain-containing protein [Phycisphaerales bacterium]|nr:proprotein convertase P-domain-containing protein [Phycisphaerales bacterium]